MDEKESKRLQEEALKLAEVLWAGRDDDTARLLREGVRAMRERDELLRCPFITHCRQPPETGKVEAPRCDFCGKVADHLTPHHSQTGQDADLCDGCYAEQIAAQGGDMDLRKRHDDLDARATQATEDEKRALADFTGALEEVRQKIAKAIGMPSGVPWETLIPGVELLASRCAELEAQTRNQSAEVDVTVLQHEEVVRERDREREARVKACDERDEARDLAQAAQSRIAEQGQQIEQLTGSLSRANEERESILMALKTVRDVIVGADARIAEVLGAEPTKDAEYASDLTENVERLIGCMEENAQDHREELAALQKEVAVFKESDKTQAAEWKRHVWNIAAALNVPRVAMGRVEEPNVDQIVKFINQNVLPTFQLAQRVSEIEGQLRGQEATTPPGTNPAAELLEKAPQVECEKCGAKRIEGVEFCPSCGKD